VGGLFEPAGASLGAARPGTGPPNASRGGFMNLDNHGERVRLHRPLLVLVIVMLVALEIRRLREGGRGTP